MGRHRSDPLGLARITIAVLAVVLALGLLIVGGTALWNALTRGDSPKTAAPTPSAAAPSKMTGARSKPAPRNNAAGNTIKVRCLATQCPIFVAGPGPTDILYNDTLTQNAQLNFNETRLILRVDNAGAVAVTINGRLQPRGRFGVPKTYQVPAKR